MGWKIYISNELPEDVDAVDWGPNQCFERGGGYEICVLMEVVTLQLGILFPLAVRSELKSAVLYVW